MKNRYSTPKIVKAEKGWYVYFRFDGKQVRDSYGLNKIENLNKREIEYREICRLLLIKLKDGWNPNLPIGVQMQNDMYIIEALRFALGKKKDSVSKKTHSGYEGTINHIEKSIKLLGLNYLKIAETKRSHLKLVMEKCKSENKWTNKSYNKHLNHLKAVLSELIQWEAIENNPAFNIKNLPAEESILHKPPTDQEWLIIKKELITNHYSFWVYVSLIAYWGMRPNEIFSIKLGMIDMESELLVLPPKYTKNRKKYKILPIIKYIKSDFEKMNFTDLPKDYYLFGSFKEPGKGNMGKNQFLPSFIPAPTKTKTDTATRLWHKIVNIKLGINVTMYSAKKYGANKKLKAGITVDAIQKGMGHSEKEVTYIYLTEMEEQSRQKIKDETPEL